MAESEKNNIMMPDVNALVISSSPHFHDRRSVGRIMLTVILSLMPGCIAGVYFFGMDALRVLFFCVAFCVGIEMLWCCFAGKPLDTWKDGSAAVTGILLGMNLSAAVPWWICLIGSFIGICLGKQVYGGLGHNPFNPALVARVALLIGFPKLMTTWVPTRFMGENKFYESAIAINKELAEKSGITLESIKSHSVPFFTSMYDGITCATPLGMVKTADASASNPALYMDYFLGNVGGCLGETSALALLAGGIFLICMKLIKWQTPVAYIGTVFVFTAIVHKMNPAVTPDASFHILTGGLFLGAFFMATDMVTSPITGKGAFIFGMGCGIVTCLIRIWGSYPEGVSFAILFMNAWVPLIDRFTALKPFGFRKRKKGLA